MTAAAWTGHLPKQPLPHPPCPHPAGGLGANLAFRNLGISKEDRGNTVLFHLHYPGQQYAALMLTAAAMQGFFAGTLLMFAAFMGELLFHKCFLLQQRALHTDSGLK